MSKDKQISHKDPENAIFFNPVILDLDLSTSTICFYLDLKRMANGNNVLEASVSKLMKKFQISKSQVIYFRKKLSTPIEKLGNIPLISIFTKINPSDAANTIGFIHFTDLSHIKEIK